MPVVLEQAERVVSSLIPVEEMPPDEWFVCQTWSGYELRIAEHLVKNRCDFFLPLVKRRRKLNGHGRSEWVERAKFPKYLFIQGQDSRECVAEYSNRSTTAKYFATPVPNKAQAQLHEELIQLARAYEVNPYLQTVTGLKVGERVRITSGGLRGIVGVVQKIDDKQVVFLNVTLMHGAVEVGAERCEPYDG